LVGGKIPLNAIHHFLESFSFIFNAKKIPNILTFIKIFLNLGKPELEIHDLRRNNLMSQSKKKITDLHRKADVERKAKESMYHIAVNAIQNYLKILDKAGIILDTLKTEVLVETDNRKIFELSLLDSYRAFIMYEEYSQNISFKEYLQRRNSGKWLTILFIRIFKNSYRRRFDKRMDIFSDLSGQYSIKNIQSSLFVKELQRSVLKYHIMREIISEQKITEDMILKKYGLQRDELMSIIGEVQQEIKGIKINSDNATKPLTVEPNI
jgi:hypothetical protein